MLGDNDDADADATAAGAYDENAEYDGRWTVDDV